MTRVETQATGIPGVTLERDDGLLLLRCSELLTLVATAPVGAEHAAVRSLLNITVAAHFDACDAPERVTDRVAARAGAPLPYAAMLTAVPMQRAVFVSARDESRGVFVAATVGVGNATRPGEERWDGHQPGTINLIVVIDANLGPTALHECLAVATEAKALTVYEAGVITARGTPATGTSTDATIIASTQRGTHERYAGTVMPVGYLVGRAVRDAVAAGLAHGSDLRGNRR